MGKAHLSDGTVREFEDGRTAGEVLGDLARDAVAAKVDGRLVDLAETIRGDVKLEPVTPASAEGLEILRHSASHVMAQAVGRLFPNVKFAIGPAIEDGFYYDFDLEKPLTADDLEKIEAEMKKIMKEDEPIRRRVLPRDRAVEEMSKQGQDYKVELLNEIEDEETTFYTQDDFTDLCRGPHVPSTGRIGEFKLLSVAGAYWRGDEHNKMLQRIYGTTFPTRRELDEYLQRLEEAKLRDHRTISKDLELFSVCNDIGPGLILWHPKLGLVRHIIEDFWRSEHLKRGYQMVYTPHIASDKIYERSGHLENYAELMYAPMDIEGQPYRVKPMNCPGHIMIYKARPRSYRELPIRMCELGTVYRFEPGGTLHGMLRVRGFTQDDSHIFCTPEQLSDEILGVLDLADMMMKAFGYEYRAFLATRPEKYLGTEEEWDRATAALRAALDKRGLDYEIDEGGGVFYAPKIDIKVTDSLGREWQGPTIQVDLNLPKRFDITYIAPDNREHEVVMIHRTVLGSMERFIGGLIEHYAGAFPVWLAPVQVRVIAIAQAHHDYAADVQRQLKEKGFRADVDLRSEKTGFKIREATMQKIPYMLIVGGKEVTNGTVAVRHRTEGDKGPAKLADFMSLLEKMVKERT